MPKIKAARGAGGEKHAPLAEQILSGEAVRAGTREKRRGRGTGEEEEEYVGPRLTRRILQQARQQQEELEAEHGAGARSAAREPTTRLGERRGGVARSRWLVGEGRSTASSVPQGSLDFFFEVFVPYLSK